jgi:hypothetical protein
MGNGVDDLELRLDGVALGLVGLRAEGRGSRQLAFSEAGGDFVGFWVCRAETPAQRDDTQDVNDFLTREKGVSWVASVSASRSLLLVS